jgi:hypothetical protein
MDFTTFAWTTLAAFLTLATFSFLYKDNPLYKIAEHLVVGVSVGYFAIIVWHNGLIRKLWFERLSDGDWFYLWLNSSKPWYLIPAILGILMWTRFTKKYAWLSRFPMALYIGIAAGAAVPVELSARVNKQLYAIMSQTDFGNFWGSTFLDTMAGYSQLLVLVGTLCALIYFFFSKAHTGVFGRLATFGIWVLMIGFGASFGFTVMARISLFIQRIQFMDKSWARYAFDSTNPEYHAGFQVLFWLVVLLVVGYTAFELVRHFASKTKAA